MIWHCINNHGMLDDTLDTILSMEEFYKIYGGRLMRITIPLPAMSIGAPVIEYEINEAIITHDGEYTYLELLIDEDDNNISIQMEGAFVEILKGEHLTKNGYILAYIYSKHKNNECFEVAKIKINKKYFNI